MDEARRLTWQWTSTLRLPSAPSTAAKVSKSASVGLSKRTGMLTKVMPWRVTMSCSSRTASGTLAGAR